jgi:hypothetical protein
MTINVMVALMLLILWAKHERVLLPGMDERVWLVAILLGGILIGLQYPEVILRVWEARPTLGQLLPFAG